jgi:hypothetical protein
VVREVDRSVVKALFLLYIHVNQKNIIMTNIELLKLILSKIENVRDEINDLTTEVVADENYDLIFDTLCTRLESDLCNAIDTVNELIDDVE